MLNHALCPHPAQLHSNLRPGCYLFLLKQMFETNAFRVQLESTIKSEAARSGLTQYESEMPEIIYFLQNQAIENESILMRDQRLRPLQEHRGIDDALVSVRIIVRQAAQYATQRGETTLTREDVGRAYLAQICRIWPFCR